MTDASRLSDPSQIIEHLPPMSALIIRDHDVKNAERTARRLLPLCRAFDVALLVSCTIPPSRLYGDGLHIPENALGNWRQTDLLRLGPTLVTTSAHGLSAIHRAQHFGADAVLVSPVFATKSHIGAKPLGYMRFAGLVRQAGMPVVALGGIQRQHGTRIFMTGCHGIAGISLFTEALEAQ